MSSNDLPSAPKLFFILILKREIGTPNLLLNEFFEHVVDEIWERQWFSKFLNDVFPALPVTAIAFIFDKEDSLEDED